ncbi:MAG: glycosyltransferase, partial [Candidatus Neomarinimicrobiota bacterium]
MNLTTAMIVRNEAAYLEECLRSIQSVSDQIVIVDTGSTDSTLEIARKYKADIYHFDWVDDFAAARNESLKYAKGNWVLCIDADERLEP